MKTPKEEREVIEGSLYGGKVLYRFFPDTHIYMFSVKGAPYKRKTGSTTYLGVKDKSTALGIWQQTMTADFLLKKIAEGVKINEDVAIEAVIQNDIAKDEAADIGSEMHEWLEKYIKFKLKTKGYNEIPEIPNSPEATNGVNAFLQWEKENKPKYISSERIVYSMKNDCSGTLDLEAVIDGVTCLVDFKSSNGLYNTVRAQTASYARFDEEERKKKVYGGRWALRFSKYTEAEYMRREERKIVIKRKIAEIKGKEYKEKTIAPYQVFEAKFLDKNKGMMEDDFDAFIHFKALYEWSNRTDWYYNPEY